MSQRTLIRNISFLLYMAYAAVMESSPNQATLGKRVLGLSVGDYSGQRLGLKASFIRNFGKLISISVLGLGFLWVLFDKERQGWHDKMAKTLVVKN
ncbi:MAG: RDD family protein [bacterium]|nr:RDD family protein [bacterium]